MPLMNMFAHNTNIIQNTNSHPAASCEEFFRLNGSGKGVVNIETFTLSAGTYSYTLIVDGKKIETKKTAAS